MNKMLSLSAVAFLAAGAVSHAAVYFQNTGVKSGWDTTAAQRKGSVTEVTSPRWGSSGTSLRCRQIFEAADGNRYHAEAVKRRIQLNGQDRHYGQAIYIPTYWPTGEVAVIQQWATEVYPSGSGGPWFGMNYNGTSLLWDAVRGPMAPGDPAAFATISKGQWIRVIARVNMKTSGSLEVWVNGSRKLNKAGDWSTNWADGDSIRWSTGIYIGWHNRQPVGPGDLSVYHDQFRVASSPYEADPVHW
jgi:hypothetical protein